MSDPLFNNVPIDLEQRRKTKRSNGHSAQENDDILKNIDSFYFDVAKHNVSDPGMAEIRQGYLQTAFTYPQNSNGKEGDSMDESNKWTLDHLTRDAREREERYYKDAQEREKRYREDMLEQDRRWRQESKEREDRLLSAINDMKSDLRSDFKDVKDEAKTTKFTVIGLTISVILGVAAMVVAVVLAK
ncbi:hypothetical protein NZ043_27675 [Paenibacillus sp. FSL k6-2145]|uniref:hypothetical protein n=1 Tax=Paenibacillus sp. FSL k6-2145 TaxID=2976834 RepID=UPI0030DD9B9B